jgi:hypothetical protein
VASIADPSVAPAQRAGVVSTGRRGIASYLLAVGLIAALAAGNYIGWIHNYLVADSWSLIGAISEPGWTAADLLPFRTLPHEINSTSYYAPVYMAVLWLAHKIGGFSPEPYHLLLVTLHVGTSLFIFDTVSQLTGSRLKATVAASIFAVHFASTEAVGWFAAITHPMTGFFGAASLAMYSRYLVSRRRIWWIGALAALLAAAFTQATALPWFAILACLDILYSSRSGEAGRRREMMTRVLVLGGLLAAMVPLQIHSLGFGTRSSYLYEVGPWVLRNLLFYPVSTVMPSLEGPSYSLTRDLVLAPTDPEAFIRLVSMPDAFIMLMASALAVILALFLLSRGGWLERFAVLSFLLSTSPFLALDGHGYRYLYVPLIFFAMLAGSAIGRLYEDARRHSTGTTLAVLMIVPVFVVLSFAESQRQMFWWQQAGFIAHKSLVQLKEIQPEFPEGAKTVFGGVPDTLHNTNAQI